MTFIQLIAVSVYLGMPVVILVRWIVLANSVGKAPASLMAWAMGLWFLQAGIFAFATFACIGGHCRVSAFTEGLVVALVGGAFLGMAYLLWLSWRPPPKRTLSARPRQPPANPEG